MLEYRTASWPSLYGEDDERCELTTEWKHAAMVIDRFCLLTFTSFTAILPSDVTRRWRHTAWRHVIHRHTDPGHSPVGASFHRSIGYSMPSASVQIRRLADIAHSKYSFTYLLTYLLDARLPFYSLCCSTQDKPTTRPVTLSRILRILKSNGMMPFCSLFVRRPSYPCTIIQTEYRFEQVNNNNSLDFAVDIFFYETV